MGWQSKHSSKQKRIYCPFKKFCVYLEGALEFSTAQVIAFRKRLEELESDKNQLEFELVQVLRAPFTRETKPVLSETIKKRGAPIGHKGWFRKKPKHIDKYVDVYLNKCPYCGSKAKKS